MNVIPVVDCSVLDECKLAVSSALEGGVAKSGGSDDDRSALLSSISRLNASTPRSTSPVLVAVDERSEFARKGLRADVGGGTVDVDVDAEGIS